VILLTALAGFLLYSINTDYAHAQKILPAFSALEVTKPARLPLMSPERRRFAAKKARCSENQANHYSENGRKIRDSGER
jgi:hypothetical protein